MDLVTMDI